jgi:ActR/RegA family two-component response regulator
LSHVLIVDDERDSASMMAALIAAEQCTVATAHNLRDARRQMALQQPDIVRLDLQLPDGSGMDLFDDSQLVAHSEVVPITGHASLETSVQALRLGAADYLTTGAVLRCVLNQARSTLVLEEVAVLAVLHPVAAQLADADAAHADELAPGASVADDVDAAPVAIGQVVLEHADALDRHARRLARRRAHGFQLFRHGQGHGGLGAAGRAQGRGGQAGKKAGVCHARELRGACPR